jgi:anion transporter
MAEARGSAALIAGLAIACSILVFFMQPFALPPPAAKAAALGIFAIGLWSTRILAEHVTAIIFFLIAELLSIAPASIVFSGFESDAFWLTFGGLIIGVAIGETGLGVRLAHAIASRLGNKYWQVVTGAALSGSLLAVVMPSTMGRTVLIIPIVAALAEELGFASGSRGHVGMILSAGFSSYMISVGILPANLPNVVLLGLSRSLYNIQITYGEYALLHLPITGVLKVVAVIVTVCVMFPDQPQRRHIVHNRSPFSRNEKWLLALLAGCIVLWATDFIHHISPAWVALGAAVICLLPRPGLISPGAFNEKVNYGALFFVAAFLGLAAILAESGLGIRVGTSLAGALALEPGDNWWNFVKLCVLATVISLTATTAGVPAVLTPMAANLSAAAGMPVMTVLMTQVFGFSTLILPYQGAPLLMTMHLGRIRTGDGARICIVLTVVTFVVLIPLNYLWWRLLGYFN